MKNKFEYTLLLVILFTNISYAQNRVFNDLKVDSSTFAQTRATLNQLNTDKFEKQSYKQGEKELPFRILFPKNYDQRKKYPLILTFHNSTRIGNDNENQLEPLARIWLREEIYNQYNCIVVAPQFDTRSSNYIANKNGILSSKPSNDVHLVLALINDLKGKYSAIDQNRVYLVGYSMGASTVQNLLAINPNLFAAAVSMAAVPDLSNVKAFHNKNIWLIHGAKDDENPFIGSETLFNQIKSNKSIKFTIYNELNHNNITIPFLLNDEIPEWLFKQKR